MPELEDGQTARMQGSAREPYVLKNVGGVYSCSCPAWKNQSLPIERRTCKHLISLRGEKAEAERLGGTLPKKSPKASTPKAAAPALLLAHTWDNEQDVAGWWLSEKLDGVRAYFTGERFLSRQGNVFHAPDWFIRDLPKMPLDGELWLDRKKFQRTVSIVRRHDQSDQWQQIRFLIFDAPAVNSPFEERIAEVQDKLAQSPARFVGVLEQQTCRGLDHLRAELARVESLGGEGLMLRQPGSQYEAGRSNTLLKLKSFHDMEAHVIDHQAGRGRHKGRLGALIVKLADGTTFNVGTGFSDAQRESPPPVGSTITFRYQELSDGGVPRFPSFVRLATE